MYVTALMGYIDLLWTLPMPKAHP